MSMNLKESAEEWTPVVVAEVKQSDSTGIQDGVVSLGEEITITVIKCTAEQAKPQIFDADKAMKSLLERLKKQILDNEKAQGGKAEDEDGSVEKQSKSETDKGAAG
ncbi:unnamed protein product [Orchesella dallaii]|uniref:Uncharacterized protein n=1 Tax=Orchesella dallaii TaxID=48710 RepID=A0ABP1R4M3_9HEXA